MITRIRGRHAFARLARDGTRIRSASLWCTWCPDPTSNSTAVAFAISRAYGPAVRRNRLRRRLRAVLSDLDQTEVLPSGMMMIGPHRSIDHELTFDDVRTNMMHLAHRLRGSSV